LINLNFILNSVLTVGIVDLLSTVSYCKFLACGFIHEGQEKVIFCHMIG